MASGEEIAVLEGHSDWVRNLAFSPTGDILASASNDGTVRLWDVASGEEIAVRTSLAPCGFRWRSRLTAPFWRRAHLMAP